MQWIGVLQWSPDALPPTELIEATVAAVLPTVPPAPVLSPPSDPRIGGTKTSQEEFSVRECDGHLSSLQYRSIKLQIQRPKPCSSGSAHGHPECSQKSSKSVGSGGSSGPSTDQSLQEDQEDQKGARAGFERCTFAGSNLNLRAVAGSHFGMGWTMPRWTCWWRPDPSRDRPR